MCLAVAGKVVTLDFPHAQVDVEGNSIQCTAILVPDVKVDEFVLVHAGFAIAIISEDDYQENRRIYQEIEEKVRDVLEAE